MDTQLHHLQQILSQITGYNFQHSNSVNPQKLVFLETKINSKLPEDFKNFLVNAPQNFPFFEYEILDIDGMIDNWRILNELEAQGEFEEVSPWYLNDNDKLRNTWWDKNWIPFAIDNEDNLICIDLAPLSKGNVGQVFYWQTMGGAHTPKAPNLTSFLAWYEEELKNGHFFFDKETHILEEIFDEKQLF